MRFADTTMTGRSSHHPLEGLTILQIIPALHGGGAERSVIDGAEALASVGARALVASRGGRLVGELQAKGGTWIPFPADSKNPLVMASNIGRLKALIRSERVAIVHAHSRAPAWAAWSAARACGVPFITSYHGVYGARSSAKARYNAVMARGDYIIANSAFTANHVCETHPDAADRVRIIQCGTDLNIYAPSLVDANRVAALRTRWRVQPHERVVLLAARLTALKGHLVLIEAARQMALEGLTDTVFILAGDADGKDRYVGSIDTAIAKAGLEGIVRRVGFCEDMPAAYRAAAVVVVPSTEPETFGRVAAEAQAMGTPVIVSDLGAAPETVLSVPAVEASRRTGWRVPAGDASALAAALQEVLGLGASARDALGQRARHHIDIHFSYEQAARRTLALYAEALGLAARPSPQDAMMQNGVAQIASAALPGRTDVVRAHAVGLPAAHDRLPVGYAAEPALAAPALAGGHGLSGRNILQIIPALDAGGAEQSTLDVAQALAASGARSLVASEGGRLVETLQREGSLWIPFPAATKNPLAMARNILRLQTLCRKQRVDLIHVRSRAPAWTAINVARRLGLPFVTTYHGAYSARLPVKSTYNSIMARGDIVIANSQYTAREIFRQWPDARDRIRILYSGTNMAVFDPARIAPPQLDRLRQLWGIAPGQRVVLLPARLTRWKGQIEFIRAAALVRASGFTDAVFILAGDDQGRGDYTAEIDALIRDSGLDGVVRRVGHCDDIPAACLLADVVAVPSIEPEAFGRTA
ncbi:MAG: glycosyltransferase, partial [Beijerinckiaceae bacterium]